MDYLSTAKNIFGRTKYEATDEDIKRLADNLALLETRGLGKLNQRLIDSGRGVWATIAEHNFAVKLVSRYGHNIPISYEPNDSGGRPIDFKVEMGNITYWIQMKDLAKLQRENRQDKMMQTVKEAAKEIKVGKFYSCMLSDDFEESCLPKLIEFIKDKAASASERECICFTKNNQTAKIEFWSANKISELTLGVAGDLEMVNLTGLDKGQIKQSLINAAGAFEWNADKSNINLIAIEADHKRDMDICDALFGTEYGIWNSLTPARDGWARQKDGLFDETDFSQKVAGVIAMKRKKERVEDYSLILYMNNSFKHFLEDIKKTS